MKKFLILVLILIMAPTVAFSQSLYSINNDLHTNYRTTTLTDAYIASLNYIDATALAVALIPYALAADVYTKLQSDATYATLIELHTLYSTTVSTQVWVMAQGFLSAADFSNYALKADYYNTAEINLKLSDKADTDSVMTKAYIDGTDEGIITNLGTIQVELGSDAVALNVRKIQADSADVQIEANRVSVLSKASQTQVDSHEITLDKLNPTSVPTDGYRWGAEGGVLGYYSTSGSGTGATDAVNLYVAAPANATLVSPNQQSFDDSTAVTLHGHDGAITNLAAAKTSNEIDLSTLTNFAGSAGLQIAQHKIVNDSEDVAIEANKVAIAAISTGVSKAYVDGTDEAIIIDNDSQDVTIEKNKVGWESIEVTLRGGASSEVLTRTPTGYTWTTPSSGGGGGTAVESVGTYVSTTTWEFNADYDTTAVCIYRNGVYQKRALFSTVDVASKTRVVFATAINASDEVILISNK